MEINKTRIQKIMKTFEEYLSEIGGLSYEYTDKYKVTSPKDFEVESGWYPLLYDLIKELVDNGWDKTITQVKEKFGGLRFYISTYNETLEGIINKYEKLSYQTCEWCGEPGKIRNDIGWYRTLCDNHHKFYINNKIKLSFDFDGTLSLPSVEEFAKELIEQGYSVYITTSRVNDSTSYQPWIDSESNKDIWELCDRIGLNKYNVNFTAHDDKINFLRGKNFLFHLDDDIYELIEIMNDIDTVNPLNVGHSDWKLNCLELLK